MLKWSKKLIQIMFPFLMWSLPKRKRLKKKLISGSGNCDSDRLSTRCQLWYPSQFSKQGHLVYIFFIQSFVMEIPLEFFLLSFLFSLMASPEKSLYSPQVLLQEDSFHWHRDEVTQITSLAFEGIRREIYWDGRRWCISVEMKEKWKTMLCLQCLGF